MNREQQLRRRLQAMTTLVIAGLVLSGATAIPLQWELDALVTWLPTEWIARVHGAIQEMTVKHPFLAYGTDWLAFGHFVIAIAFVGAWREPARNRWLFDFGLIACASVVPYALVMGGWRGIPLWWRLIDCSFGLLCAMPLWLCRRDATELAQLTAQQS